MVNAYTWKSTVSLFPTFKHALSARKSRPIVGSPPTVHGGAPNHRRLFAAREPERDTHDTVLRVLAHVHGTPGARSRRGSGFSTNPSGRPSLSSNLLRWRRCLCPDGSNVSYIVTSFHRDTALQRRYFRFRVNDTPACLDLTYERSLAAERWDTVASDYPRHNETSIIPAGR